MLRCSLYLTLSLSSILVQSAGTAPCYRENHSVICEYAYNAKGELIPELQMQSIQDQLVEDALEEYKMQLMQQNLLEILLALNLFIIICLAFEAYDHMRRKTSNETLFVKEVMLK